MCKKLHTDHEFIFLIDDVVAFPKKASVKHSSLFYKVKQFNSFEGALLNSFSHAMPSDTLGIIVQPIAGITTEKIVCFLSMEINLKANRENGI